MSRPRKHRHRRLHRCQRILPPLPRHHHSRKRRVMSSGGRVSYWYRYAWAWQSSTPIMYVRSILVIYCIRCCSSFSSALIWLNQREQAPRISDSAPRNTFKFSVSLGLENSGRPKIGEFTHAFTWKEGIGCLEWVTWSFFAVKRRGRFHEQCVCQNNGT